MNNKRETKWRDISSQGDIPKSCHMRHWQTDSTWANALDEATLRKWQRVEFFGTIIVFIGYIVLAVIASI